MRPAVGSHVRVLGGPYLDRIGSIALVKVDDGSDTPFLVQFRDGTSAWYRAQAIQAIQDRQLRADLEGLKVGLLKTKARDEQISKENIEKVVDDADNPQQALITLIVRERMSKAQQEGASMKHDEPENRGRAPNNVQAAVDEDGVEEDDGNDCLNQMVLVSCRDVSNILQEFGLNKEHSNQIIDKLKSKSERVDSVKHDDDLEDIDDIIRDALQTIFNECDADKSGHADFEELVSALETYTELASECGFPRIMDDFDRASVEHFFKEADENDDEGLTWNEFLKHMARLTKEKMASANMAIMSKLSSRGAKPAKEIIGDMSTNLDDDLDIKQALSEWRMDYWKLDENQQLKVVVQAFNSFHVWKHKTTPFDASKFNAFFKSVKSEYNAVPYHNFFHALSTVHYSLKLVQAAGMTDKLQSAELISLVLGALCHDIGHRGRNTAFEVQSKSDLAMRYNDRSPLENHHCARAFQIAFQTPADECNIFKNWNQEEYHRVRKLMVSIILGTDMALHNEHVKKLTTMTEVQDQLAPEGAEFLLEIFVHSADIGNAIMPQETSMRWSKALAEEFTAQVSDERKLGLPVSKFMDGLDDPLKSIKSQIGFLDFVASPLFQPLVRLFPSVSQAQTNLTKNRERLKREGIPFGRQNSALIK